MACHFIAALKIPALRSTRERLMQGAANEDEYFDIDTCMDVEASDTDVEVIQSLSITDFNAGDVVGKIMAFIAQIRACSEDTRDYLQHLAVSHGCPKWEIKLWVRTRWGSLSDCFSVVLVQRKVGFPFYFYFYFFAIISLFRRPSMHFVFSPTIILTSPPSLMAKIGPITS
jgi:hypothetical protein